MIRRNPGENLFTQWRDLCGESGRSVPMYFSEYGADAYDSKSGRIDEEAQARAVIGIWEQIDKYRPDGDSQAPVCVGGNVCEFCDEWWPHGNPWEQDIAGIQVEGAPYDNMMNMEWFGLFTIDRTPRKAYFDLMRVWRSQTNKTRPGSMPNRRRRFGRTQ
jgi:hypothetical protein